jgi:filamentous hemagglutinin family protein
MSHSNPTSGHFGKVLPATLVRSPWLPVVWSVAGLAGCFPALAGPEGLTVGAGSATVTHAGPVTTIQVSDRAVLNWSSFNVAAGETASFIQPSQTSIAWNQISDPNPSRIFGRVQANGILVLANQSGFWFGPDSVVRAASFVATTSGGPPAGFLGGDAWTITVPPPLASIINYGHIDAGNGGSVFLVAEKVVNQGVLTAPDGTIGLYAGKEVLISERPDGRGLSARVNLPSGSVDNLGRINAPAGRIALEARVVNQGGIITADSVRERDGQIELVASQSVTLAPGSRISAAGDAQGVSPGGTVTVLSGGAYTDDATARVSVAGGQSGGNGGHLEISANQMTGVLAELQGTAAPGYSSGRLLIDPDSIVIASNGTGSPGTGVITPGSSPSTLTLNPSALARFSTIALQSNGTIDVNAAWNLPDRPEGGASLLLEAARDVRIGQSGGIFAGTGWNVSIIAGSTFTGGAVTPGTGSIQFNGSGAISAVDGRIALSAGQDVTVRLGYVRTTGGGSIAVTAAAGSINAGTNPNGYIFSTIGSGYRVNPSLGGISTAAGGDVTLVAGRDVTSFLPTGISGSHQDAGSGAFGPQHGDVTIRAGRSVFGHYVVANGTGTIEALESAGDGSRQLALSLVDGDWNVSANNILMQEVRNPNGALNRLGRATVPAPTYHLFDYADDASVSLNARNSVQLAAGSVPRAPAPDDTVPVVYPPILRARAGAGGISLGSLILAPSPLGQLELVTTAGGSLRNLGGTIVMSDSGFRQYDPNRRGRFGETDLAPTPLHLNDLVPARLDIDGSIVGIQLSLPKPATIRVGGDIADSSFRLQNLRAGDVSRFDVAGAIRYRPEYTFLTIPADVAAPDLGLLAIAFPGGVPNDFVYNPATRLLALRGRINDSQRLALQNLTVRTFDPATGVELTRPDGEPITRPATFLPASFIDQLYQLSQNVPSERFAGFRIGGPGSLDIRAGSIDLGASDGIVSYGPGFNPAVALYNHPGASVSIQTAGDLRMFSSAIVSQAGGALTLDAGGRIEVGTEVALPSNGQSRGIYSTAGSPVTVTANGDINVNGSRIATFDGGTLTVLSRTGDIDAGSGGQSLQSVQQFRVQPDGSVVRNDDIIPGSGILATTFTTGSSQVGNVSVSTPRGDVLARSGGIVQASFNGTPSSTASLLVTAGTRAADGTTVYEGRIDASRSGVIGGNVRLDATGPVVGVVFASGNININTPQNVNVTALAQGNVSIGAGGTVSGTVVGIGSVSASGSSIDANLLSQSVTTSGGSSGQVGFGTANAAGAASTAAAGTASNETAKTAPAENADDDSARKGNRRIVLSRTVGRVTVILPQAKKL